MTSRGNTSPGRGHATLTLRQQTVAGGVESLVATSAMKAKIAMRESFILQSRRRCADYIPHLMQDIYSPHARAFSEALILQLAVKEHRNRLCPKSYMDLSSLDVAPHCVHRYEYVSTRWNITDVHGAVTPCIPVQGTMSH